MPAALFPKSNEIQGWTLASAPIQFQENRLFDYMDGAAEIPKSYTFRSLGSAKYQMAGNTLELAIFDMGDAADAFGYYSARVFLEHSPRSKERIIALEHPAHLYSTVGVLTFWKDHYTVILQPDNGKPDEASLLLFARFVSSQIGARGAEPLMLRRLPAAGQVASSARFIRGKAAFDSTVMFTARDLFGLSKGPEAVAAEYSLRGGVATLVIIKYANQEAARLAVSSFHQIMVAGKAVVGKSTLPTAFVCQTVGRAKAVGVMATGNEVLLSVGANDVSTADSGLKKLFETTVRK